MLRIRKKDKVVVLAGRDRNKRGEVLSLDPGRGRVVVSKINLVKKHARPKPPQPGGIQQKEASLPLSRVMLVCPKCDRPVRPKVDRLVSGEKVRICRNCGETIL